MIEPKFTRDFTDWLVRETEDQMVIRCFIEKHPVLVKPTQLVSIWVGTQPKGFDRLLAFRYTRTGQLGDPESFAKFSCSTHFVKLTLSSIYTLWEQTCTRWISNQNELAAFKKIEPNQQTIEISISSFELMMHYSYMLAWLDDSGTEDAMTRQLIKPRFGAFLNSKERLWERNLKQMI